MEELNIDEADAASLQVFMNTNPQPRKTLADIIMEKINGKIHFYPSAKRGVLLL